MTQSASNLIRAFLLLALSAALPPSFLLAQEDKQARTPESVIRTAQIIFIQPRSEFFDRAALERELLKNPDFRRWGMVITANREEADLIAEVTRKKFTTRFTIRLIDPLKSHVLAAAEASSLGGEIEPKLADRFARLVRPYRDK
jgi:hypothetical protein